jgi:hypothetical protein
MIRWILIAGIMISKKEVQGMSVIQTPVELVENHPRRLLIRRAEEMLQLFPPPDLSETGTS